MGYPTRARCTLCPWSTEIPVADGMHKVKSRVYAHLQMAHGLTGRPRNLESDRITLPLRVPAGGV